MHSWQTNRTFRDVIGQKKAIFKIIGQIQEFYYKKSSREDS